MIYSKVKIEKIQCEIENEGVRDRKFLSRCNSLMILVLIYGSDIFLILFLLMAF